MQGLNRIPQAKSNNTSIENTHRTIARLLTIETNTYVNKKKMNDVIF